LVVIGGIAFPTITLAGLLAYDVILSKAGSGAPRDKTGVLAIEVTGEQWWWRVTYPSADGKLFASANEIRIPVGREVLFTLKSADVIHSFWVPSLGGKVDMIPGRTTTLRVSADRPGIFRGQCAEYCGGPHALMALPVIAMPDAEFQAWLAGEAGPAAAPADATETRGQSLFLAAGCGACHAVRGTNAGGVVGPDLTHFGGRRSIGADTLPLTRDNIIRFIVEGQHVKPGNTMPEFKVFTDDERIAIAAYLSGLR
jgi:cytochrome c oxidase subunit 2